MFILAEFYSKLHSSDFIIYTNCNVNSHLVATKPKYLPADIPHCNQ